jgi:hypothetical protein
MPGPIGHSDCSEEVLVPGRRRRRHPFMTRLPSEIPIELLLMVLQSTAITGMGMRTGPFPRTTVPTMTTTTSSAGLEVPDWQLSSLASRSRLTRSSSSSEVSGVSGVLPSVAPSMLLRAAESTSWTTPKTTGSSKSVTVPEGKDLSVTRGRALAPEVMLTS